MSLLFRKCTKNYCREDRTLRYLRLEFIFWIGRALKSAPKERKEDMKRCSELISLGVTNLFNLSSRYIEESFYFDTNSILKILGRKVKILNTFDPENTFFNNKI